jgi:hypothetical protein
MFWLQSIFLGIAHCHDLAVGKSSDFRRLNRQLGVIVFHQTCFPKIAGGKQKSTLDASNPSMVGK